MKNRPCRVDIATARREEQDSRLSMGNWRDGHQVVESSRPRMERSTPTAPGGPSPSLAPSGNWRETAKPVQAAPTKDVSTKDAPPKASSLASAAPKKPELKILPRTAPIENDSEKLATDQYKKSSKPNPFGAAKPREVVLAEKKSHETPQD